MTLTRARAAGSRRNPSLPRRLSASTWGEPLPHPRHFPPRRGGRSASLCRAGPGTNGGAGGAPGPLRARRRRPAVLQCRLQVSAVPCALRPPRPGPAPPRVSRRTRHFGTGIPADPALWDGDPGGPKAGLSPHRPGDGGRGTPRSAEAAPLSAGVRALTSHLLLPSARPLGADIAAVISASFHSLFPHFPKKIHPERWIPSRAEGDRQCLLLLRGKD